MRTLATVLFLVCHLILSGQIHQLKGRVVDAESGEPLAFVNMVINEGKLGSTTDIDGKFNIRSGNPIETVSFTYVGYEEKTLEAAIIAATSLIKLKPKNIYLPEVEVFPKENPANRIIENVIENRKNNNPENLNSFSYTSYDKMYFTTDADSAKMKAATKADSSFSKMKRFFDEQHMFMMETVTERKYLHPDRNYEKVVASRISGFKDPIILFMISQMQSTSFYDEIIHILNRNYVNPISRGSISKYFFLIEDTAYTANNDSVFIISYRPRKNTNFDGMEGVLSINSSGWAIQNVIARPAERRQGLNVKIQQMYELIDGEHWFPVQLNTEIILNQVNVQVDTASFAIAGIGKSYIRDIVLNPELVAREFSNVEVEVDAKAHKRDSSYWAAYRVDTLSSREKRTYEFLDSLGREHHFDEIARSVDIMLTGEIPWGPVNLDLDKFISYNEYEGLYLGIGGHTNDKLSRSLKLGGYFGYGFKDKTAKYGANIKALINRRHNLKFGASYFYDAVESGGVHFFDKDANPLKSENLRDFLLKRMNMTENVSAYLRFTTLNYLTLDLSISRQFKEAYRDYHFVSDLGIARLQKDQFVFSELGIGFRYAFREKFIQTQNSKVSLGTKYPVVLFQYRKGMKDLFDGQFDYNRYDLKIEDSFYSKYLGETSLRLQAGFIDADLPYCNLYNGNGSYRKFTLYAPYSFATMRMNEFLSDKYVALYFYHNFDNLIFGGERFKPEFAIATNVAFGSLQNPGVHRGSAFQTMEKGYYESGFLINNLLDLKIYNMGLGAFYRYGSYSFNNAWDNLAIKLSVNFAF